MARGRGRDRMRGVGAVGARAGVAGATPGRAQPALPPYPPPMLSLRPPLNSEQGLAAGSGMPRLAATPHMVPAAAGAAEGAVAGAAGGAGSTPQALRPPLSSG